MALERPARALDPGDASPTEAVPAYFHPAVAADAWETLTERVAGGQVRLVVVNATDGPDGAADDPRWLDAVRRIADAGAGVHGYVDLGHLAGDDRRPTRSGRHGAAAWTTQAVTDLDHWDRLLGGRLAGVFLDCAPAAPDRRQLTLLHGLIETWRARRPTTSVVLNPGVAPERQVARLADVVVSFEGTAADHEAACRTMDPRLATLARTWHVVHGVRDDETAAAVTARAAALGVSHLTLSPLDGPNPYRALPLPVPVPARAPSPSPSTPVAEPIATAEPIAATEPIAPSAAATTTSRTAARRARPVASPRTTVSPAPVEEPPAELAPPMLEWSRHELRITTTRTADDIFVRAMIRPNPHPNPHPHPHRTGPEPDRPLWRTADHRRVAARWLLENGHLYEYVGDGHDWSWRDRGPVPVDDGPAHHTWTIDPHRIGDADAYEVVCSTEATGASRTPAETARTTRWSDAVTSWRVRGC